MIYIVFEEIQEPSTINVGAKVDFADVVILKNSCVSSVGSVVGSTVVEGAASWKS